ncbi:zonular occludens toxin domain-containing protein [Paenibacillus sp. FSL F4-0125]|uniref:zonular occludens toxin domain-containing protein n=1 Tax=Paenibacillus sp. FSL F4-0125 TaxID=2954730 RepID=UPI0030F9A3C4
MLLAMVLTINQYIGTIGSGKTYHALEDIIKHLSKGGYVIANFPINFPPGMVRKGYADRFMYIPTEILEDEAGMALFMKMSEEYGFDEFKKLCLVVLDEAGDLYPSDKATDETQRKWKKFFKTSRHMGYDFTLIMQDEKEINRTITSCMEYKVVHRKANRIFPFKYLPFTLFMHITYWKQSRQKLSSGSTIFVKSFSKLYNTHQYRNAIKIDTPEIDFSKYNFDAHFGNCKPVEESGGLGGQPVGGTQAAGTSEELTAPLGEDNDAEEKDAS